MNTLAIAPIIVIGAVFVVYCWWDIARAGATRGLPRWAWAVVCVITIPLGGVLYLTLGRDQPTATGPTPSLRRS